MVEETEAQKAANKQKAKKGLKATIVQWVAIFAILGTLGYVFIIHEGPLPWETPAEPELVEPANVELYRFSDLKGWNNETNETLNVEIWLKNTGEEIARDLDLFVRCRNQNGTILYTDMLDLTWELLGPNETCSATYKVDYEHGDTCIETTIELRWDSGMNSYLKETDL